MALGLAFMTLGSGGLGPSPSLAYPSPLLSEPCFSVWKMATLNAFSSAGVKMKRHDDCDAPRERAQKPCCVC